MGIAIGSNSKEELVLAEARASLAKRLAGMTSTERDLLTVHYRFSLVNCPKGKDCESSMTSITRQDYFVSSALIN